MNRTEERNTTLLLRQCQASIEEIPHMDGYFLKGWVMTPDGVVLVYSQYQSAEYTRLDFARDGVVYRNERFSFHQPRFLTKLAKRFAAQMSRKS